MSHVPLLTTQVESWTEVLADLEKLFPEHYEDLSLHRFLGIPLSPDYKGYAELERLGRLVLITLRRDGEIVGYCTTLVGRNLHYDVFTAVPDLLYIVERVRRAHFAVYRRLLRATEAELRRRGVECWFSGMKLHRDGSRLLKSMGFEPVETMHCKWLT